MKKRFFRLLTELSSRKTVSRCTGAFARSRLSRRFIPAFARTYSILIDEAEKLPQEYESLNEFFTRRLKPGMRTIDDAPQTLVSPVDAVITGMGRIQDGTILNVKGQDYSVEELLNRSPRTVNYKNGYFYVLYLSPTDYHRIHSPVAGTIIEKEHVPGKVYPVNEFGLTQMRRVLSRNERLITYINHELGEVAVVKVGALNVSSIQYVNLLPNTPNRGDELAYFEFGSTVVLLAENDTLQARSDLDIGSKVKMGEALGRFKER